MIDRGDVFSARSMIRALSRQVAGHVCKAKALRDGVPGMLRASWCSFSLRMGCFLAILRAERTPRMTASLRGSGGCSKGSGW
jgi:hypothetical protein